MIPYLDFRGECGLKDEDEEEDAWDDDGSVEYEDWN
jgi:hypothetical protein